MPSIKEAENHPRKSIRIKPQEEPFSSRRLSPELPIPIDETFEVYYRDSSVGVPFLWESQPGTPKAKFKENDPLPPLTPPPSFHSNLAKNPAKNHLKYSNLVQSFLPKVRVKNGQVVQQSSPSSSTSSSSSMTSSPMRSSPWSMTSHSVPSSPFNNTPTSREQQGRFSSTPRMSTVHSRIDEDGYGQSGPGALCFNVGRRSSVRPRGYSSKIIKLLRGEVA